MYVERDQLMLEIARQSSASIIKQQAHGMVAKTLVSKNDVTVVVPVLNEEHGVTLVLDELVKNGYRNILVIDGYSTDRTVEAARQHGAATVMPQHGKGKAGAIKTAIDNVSTPYLMIMDGDHTYDPADIEKFLTHANDYDEIVGIRRTENISLPHRLGNRLITFSFNTLLGASISDVCSGMYLLKSKLARRLVLQSTGFSIEVEVLAQMALHGKVTEVPITYRSRIGNPKLSTWVHGVDILKSIFSLAKRYNPVSIFSIASISTAIPAAAILGWVFFEWTTQGHLFHGAWALAGLILMLISAQAFAVGTIAILMKRSEIRIERLLRENEEMLEDRLNHEPSE
jgi:dolichol-phosphate mannosyltransferase